VEDRGGQSGLVIFPLPSVWGSGSIVEGAGEESRKEKVLEVTNLKIAEPQGGIGLRRHIVSTTVSECGTEAGRLGLNSWSLCCNSRRTSRRGKKEHTVTEKHPEKTRNVLD